MIVLALLSAILILNIQYHVNGNPRAEFNYTLDKGFPVGEKLFGNIAGLDVDKDNNVIIFHRGSHKWDTSTFDVNDIYLPNKESPILEDTVITIDPKTMKITRNWGANIFFMPHGLSLDLGEKHLWLTDVALHQVFKFTVDGSREILSIGTAFVPGNDDSHFCKPTSVADTGDFIFVADGYCNSRIAMFSAQGKYLGEFGQSSDAAYSLSNTANVQPTFNIPHKITYAKEANMLCVADRENGRIQCFSFEPKTKHGSGQNDNALLLNGAIKKKFTIADPLFNGRLFSLDYSPIKGGIIAAVSGESLYTESKPPLGFVYNVTTGQLISRFQPPDGKTFGMAHDLAITGDEAGSLYVVDISPVNLWKFSRPHADKSSRRAAITQMASAEFNRAISTIHTKGSVVEFFWYLSLLAVVAVVLIWVAKIRKPGRQNAPNSFKTLYSNSYPTSINSLFGGSRFTRRPGIGRSNALFSTMFSRKAFFNLFDRDQQQQQNDFSRIPLEDSDNDDDKSDSDVEEFNINQASPSIKINV